MAINELIARGGTPVTIDNPIKNALAISQMRGEDIKSGEAERAIRNRNMLNSLAQKHTDASGRTNLDAVRTDLASQGNWDMSTAVADKQKAQFQDDMEQAKVRQSSRNQYLAQATTKEQVMNWHKANYADPFMGKVLSDAGISADQSMAAINAIQTPEQLQEFIAKATLGSKDMFDHLAKQGDLKVKQTNAATNQGRLSVDQDRAAEEKRWHDTQDANQDALVGTKTGKVVRAVTNNAGDVVQLDAQGNQVGETLKGAGKPSATFEKTVATNKKLKMDIDSTITELEGLVKEDGLLDKATGSGIGAAADWTSNLVGHATEGAIALGAIAPIYDKVLKMVPRFEGPQSDKDTASYNKAAGDLANPNIPNEIKKSSATTILRLMGERKNQFGLKDDPTVHSGDKGAEGRSIFDDADAIINGGK